jgi:NAD(P)-dependent dehydrogenase (short-subunit alcohol dehydrogenase family)
VNRLDGKRAVVTGCSSGIGAAIARRFAAEGARVTGVDVNPADDVPLDHFVQGDVSEAETVEEAIRSAQTGGPLDVMVNNAAVQLERTLDETSVEDFDRLVAVNLRGVFLGCTRAAAAMKAGGAIVNLGSILGFTGDPMLAGYSATKGAVLNLTRTAALTYGPRGIRVNAICPGAVLTELTTRVWDLAPDPEAARERMERIYPLRRIARPDEIASVALFLASEEASAITGATIVADCGLTAANAEYALAE